MVKVSYEQLMESAEAFLKAGRLRDAISSVDQARKIVGSGFIKEIRPLNVQVRRAARDAYNSTPANRPDDTAEYYDIIKQSYRISARESFDDFCIFTEWNRPLKEKFYMPRRFALKPVVDELQKLAEGLLEILGISLPPGTGKSTLALFFCDWLAGRQPNKGMLIGSHSASILGGMYDETLRHLDPEGDYLWGEAFPGFFVPKNGTNALDMQININKNKRFANWQFASVGSNLAGKVRAQSLLYLDDLVPNIDDALNPAAMDKLWRQYTVDYLQRKMDGCPELMIATRWSVNDPMGKAEARNERNPKAKFIAIPALDEKGESNFNYGAEYGGFTTEGYKKLRDDIGDDLVWGALYMQEPVEREGQLYKPDTLRRFFTLPEGEPDAILSVCDTSNGKGDFSAMPIGYVYGQEHYIFDVAFTDDLPEISDNILATTLLKNNVQRCQFESNNAGERIANKIQAMITDREGRCKITKKHTQENKETKIVVNSDWVKAHCLFLDDSVIVKGSAYERFMRALCSYSVRSKNKHDDAPDAMAQYAIFVQCSITNTIKLYSRSSYGI